MIELLALTGVGALLFVGLMLVVENILRRRSLLSAAIGYALWLGITGFFAWSLFGQWTETAVKAGHNNIGIGIAAAMMWAILALPSATLGGLVLWYLRRRRGWRR